MAMTVLVVSAVTYMPKIVSVSTNVGGRDMPIYSVETEKPQIALSFDTSWGNEDISDILSVLAKNDVKASFFLTGHWVKLYPDDVKAIQAAGHDLGNHGENYEDMTRLADREKTSELMNLHNEVKNLTGVDMNLFRAPFGAYDNAVIQNAAENGYYTVQWSVDSLDWKDYGANAISEAVCDSENLDDGAIILLHNGTKYTAQVLDEVIATLKSKGYEFVPISQLIYKENYQIDQKGKQRDNM